MNRTCDAGAVSDLKNFFFVGFLTVIFSLIAPYWARPILRPTIVWGGLGLVLTSPLVILIALLPFLLPATAVYFLIQLIF